MAGQKFYAHPTDTCTWTNGAIGHRPGGSFDCLGPYAKVRECPIEAGSNPELPAIPGGARRTAYATGYADSYFSLPARCSFGGRTLYGVLSLADEGPTFIAHRAGR